MIDASKPQAVPSILDIANRAARAPGIEPPSPKWAATFAYMYGLPLSETYLDHLVTATHRSREAIVAHAERTLGRRRFRQLWARIGRRGRKSASAALVAVYEAHYGGHEAHIMLGEQALIAVISKDLAGASVVTKFVRLYLDALQIRYSMTRIGAVQIIEIEGCPIGIATLAATSEAPRGYALPVIILDEFAHHAIGDEYANSAGSLLDAAIPAQLQFPDALLIGISTPLGKIGKFHESVEASLGADHDERSLAIEGPNWEWNPSLTEEAVRAELQDQRVFDREGRAIPQEARLEAFPRALIEHAFRVPPLFDRTGRQIIVLDPSSGRKDAWTWMRISFVRERIEIPFGAVSSRRLETYMAPTPYGFSMQAQRYVDDPWRVQQPDGTWKDIEISRQRIIMLVEQIDGVEGRFFEQLGADQIFERVANDAKQHGITSVHSDQREIYALSALARQHGIKLVEHTWTGGDTGLKTQIVTALRRRLAEGTIIFPHHERLKKELLGFEERVTPGGSLTWGGGRGVAGADDYVACVLTAQAAEIEGGTYPNTRHETSGR